MRKDRGVASSTVFKTGCRQDIRVKECDLASQTCRLGDGREGATTNTVYKCEPSYAGRGCVGKTRAKEGSNPSEHTRASTRALDNGPEGGDERLEGENGRMRGIEERGGCARK